VNEMVILVDKETKVIVQGITGKEGRFHTKLMLEYGTKIIGGTSPGRGGENIYNVPVYDTIEELIQKEGQADASVIFVPASSAPEAVYEAMDNGIQLIVVITEHIPPYETLRFVRKAREKGITIIGPNCPGIIAPGITKLGIIPGNSFNGGRIGVVSRSGTITYEVGYSLKRYGLGVSTAVGIGGDPIVGRSLKEIAKLFEKDEETEGIVVIGEIGGTMEEELAESIRRGEIKKPVVAYIAGMTAPPEKRMGHAGAIITMGKGTASSKIEALKSVGVKIAFLPSEIPKLMKEELK
jgi:succinyl-CoA synthetase, alpha subunit